MKTTNIILEDFANPTHEWSAMNDPVMGGQSYSSFNIQNDLGIFEGEVKDVPFLHAPGFITMRGDGSYADVSSCESLQIRARAATQYSGYRVCFGYRHVGGRHGFFSYGYKADFDLPESSSSSNDDMTSVVIPFDDFTARWDDSTGDAIVTCAQNPDFCPDVETLLDMRTISIWGEGVNGKIKLEVESIQAVGCFETLRVSRLQRSFLQNVNEEQDQRIMTPTFLAGVAIVALAAYMMGVGMGFMKKQMSDMNEELHQDMTYRLCEAMY